MKKILVANRGEIACRIIKTIQKLGICAVAIYSEADRNAGHVQLADEAYCIGPPPSTRSYLEGDKIIKLAQKVEADAIHPGYGFLSENADFAKSVVSGGLIFIGPSPHSIRIMGSKLAAKKAVENHQIPMIPGTDYEIADPEEAKKFIEKIGLPVLIKASAGGGGKGMRVVRDWSDVKSQMARAISEAKSAFGDGAVFVEKYLSAPRHIEVQILADRHGNVIHLYERECSIQRRHQKVIEETPSCALTEELRIEICRAAVRVAKACQYEGAGTVEFLLDEDKNFYFLEMNTRLQVEHPITEMITGLDLVEQQIKIARGEILEWNQENIRRSGHSIELRVYAEDPENDFLPSTGVLATYIEPVGPDTRVDSGYHEGLEVPIYYDPMIAKLIVHAPDRQRAIKKMKEAIRGYVIVGIKTTLSFGSFVLDHPAFENGEYDTHFVRDFYNRAASDDFFENQRKMAALWALREHLTAAQKIDLPSQQASKWTDRSYMTE